MHSTTRFLRALLLAVIAFTLANVEAEAQRRITPSIVVGVASSTLSAPEDDVEVDRRMGLTFGVTIDVPMTPNLAFVTGLQLTQKGATVSEPSIGLEAEFEVSYLQIPALLRLDLGGQGVRPFLEGGGAFGLRVSCSVSFTVDDFTVSAPCEDAEDPDTGEPGEDPIESTDVSAIVGGGLDFGRVRVGLRYDHGLMNINRDGDGSVKNRSFVLYTSIKLTR